MPRPAGTLGSQKIVRVQTVGNEVLLDTTDVNHPNTARYLKRPSNETFLVDDIITGYPDVATDDTHPTPNGGHSYVDLVEPFARSVGGGGTALAAAAGAPPARRVIYLHGMLSCGLEVKPNHKLIVRVEL